MSQKDTDELHESYLNRLWQKPRKHRYKPTGEQEEWIVKVFPNMKNSEIAQHLGTSKSSVIRIARAHGVYKSKEFMSQLQKNATSIASVKRRFEKSRKPNIGRERTYFTKGISLVERYGKEKVEMNGRKISASLRETIRKEKARIAFGLPQKTKLRVAKQPIKKLQFKWYLKKRGYIIDEDKHIAFYDEKTKRGKFVESKEQNWFTFMPISSKIGVISG